MIKPRRLTSPFALFFIAFALSGCATSDPTVCNSINWHDQGYVHAINGELDQSQEAATDCARKDAPNAYRAGFDSGLEKFCTYKKGLMTGETGQNPTLSCADSAWDEYQNGYLTGRKIFDVNARLEAISQSLEVARHHLWELEQAGQTKNSPAIKAKHGQIEQLKRERAEASQTLMNLQADTRNP